MLIKFEAWLSFDRVKSSDKHKGVTFLENLLKIHHCKTATEAHVANNERRERHRWIAAGEAVTLLSAVPHHL